MMWKYFALIGYTYVLEKICESHMWDWDIFILALK